MKNKYYNVLLGALVVSGFLPSSLAKADIFKCINDKGATYYNDKPCLKSSVETKFKHVKDQRLYKYPDEKTVPKKELKNTTENRKNIKSVAEKYSEKKNKSNDTGTVTPSGSSESNRIPASVKSAPINSRKSQARLSIKAEKDKTTANKGTAKKAYVPPHILQ